jgi:hypothetical protein
VHGCSGQRAARGWPKPGERYVPPKPPVAERLPDVGRDIGDGRGELVEAGDRYDHQAAAESLDDRTQRGRGRRERRAVEPAADLLRVGLPEEPQRDVPVLRRHPPHAALLGPGQGCQLLGERGRRPHRYEQA